MDRRRSQNKRSRDVAFEDEMMMMPPPEGIFPPQLEKLMGMASAFSLELKDVMKQEVELLEIAGKSFQQSNSTFWEKKLTESFEENAKRKKYLQEKVDEFNKAIAEFNDFPTEQEGYW